MDCPGRAVFKQLMDHGTVVGDTMDFRKSIIVLEANVGWLQMQELINQAGSRDKVRAGSGWELLHYAHVHSFRLWARSAFEALARAELPPPRVPQVSMEDAHRELKEKVFSKWRDEKCEEYVDTLKTMSLISMCVARPRAPAAPSDAVRAERNG